MDFISKKHHALVIGLGFRSGLAAANFLVSKGCTVEVSDTKSREDLADLTGKLDPKVKVHAGNQSPELLDSGIDLVVLSPGVPAKIALVQQAIAKKIPVISEIELAYRYMKGYVVGITGTDGKSTTTALTHHIFSELGWDSRMGGNIGIPLVSIAEQTIDKSVTVIELSSYQLETIDTFRPDAAAMLNLTPDHLDRYNSLDDYFAAKMRIAMNQTQEDFFIYNADDQRVEDASHSVKSMAWGFSLEPGSRAYFENGSVFMQFGNECVKAFNADEMTIMGVHNIQNAMTALLLVQAICIKSGVPFPIEHAAQACCSFKGLPHRMEKIGVYQGRTFINDSKATTVGALEMALKSLQSHAVLVLGGRAKGDDYSRLVTSMQGRIRALVLIGETRQEFSEIFSMFPQSMATDMNDAVRKAFNLSEDGDAVLLSPATASFDMFKSFEHRGDAFRESVKNIIEGR